jgi:hypothetical protein
MEEKNLFIKIIEQTTDFSFIDFIDGINRPMIEPNVHGIINSFEEFGSASANAILIETKVFGSTKIIIGDGQHTVEASKRSGYPINLIIVRLKDDTRHALIKYISTLNNTKVSWSTKTYVDRFADNGIIEYKLFNEIKKEYKLTVTDLLNIYLFGDSSKEHKMFKSGNMKFENLNRSNQVLNVVVACKDRLPNKAFIRRNFIKQVILNYDLIGGERIISSVLNYKNNFSEQEITFKRQINAEFKRAVKQHSLAVSI